MPTFLKNRYVRFIGITLAVLLGGLMVLFFAANLFMSSQGLSSDSIDFAPGMEMSLQKREFQNAVRDDADSMQISSPEVQSGYTSNLEEYEISSYTVSARTRDFEPLCDTLETFKVDNTIDYKSLTRSTNNCRATFYVEQPRVSDVLHILNAYDGVEVNRSTESVTRHREQIQSQTSILQQQLASVERSLAIAETEFDEIAAFARENNDAKTLASAIREKLSLIDTLTQRKISLASRIDSYLQQAADLEERLNVVEFTVNIYRSHPLSLNQTAREWEQAWAELGEQFTDTLIGLTAFFGIFLLWSVRIAVYTLVGIVIVRGLWKFARLVWRRW